MERMRLCSSSHSAYISVGQLYSHSAKRTASRSASPEQHLQEVQSSRSHNFSPPTQQSSCHSVCPTLQTVIMATNKIAANSPSRAHPSEIETNIASALYDLESNQPDMKSALRPLQIVSAREVCQIKAVEDWSENGPSRNSLDGEKTGYTNIWLMGYCFTG